MLVVGSGSSAVRIVDELLRATKQFFISVGRIMSHLVTIAVTGAEGGRAADFRDLTARGITPLGMTLSCSDALIKLMSDLSENIGLGDANYLTGLVRPMPI